MPRVNRVDISDIVYHVINRANVRMQIFDTDKDYINLVNMSHTEKEIESLRSSVNKGKPYGYTNWVDKLIEKFSLGVTLKNPGRLKKDS